MTPNLPGGKSHILPLTRGSMDADQPEERFAERELRLLSGAAWLTLLRLLPRLVRPAHPRGPWPEHHRVPVMTNHTPVGKPDSVPIAQLRRMT